MAQILGYNTAINGQFGNINDVLKQVLKDLEISYQSFMEWSAVYWASDNAVAFKAYADSKEVELENKYVNLANQMLIGVSGSINAAIAAQPSGVSSVTPELLAATQIDVKFENNHGGDVGMNVPKMQEDVIPSFNRDLNTVITELDAIPNYLGLYDLDDTLIESFKTGIKNLKNDTESFFADLEQQISNYINVEIHDIQLGQAEAEAKMAEAQAAAAAAIGGN